MKRKRLVSILIPLLVLGVATLACGPTPAAKPTVAILAPPNGAQVAVGQMVEVQFHAEDAKAVLWVQMTVGSDVVATMQSPLAGGQTPLDGILRWTPSSPGAFTLMVNAHNADGQNSDPAAVSITVVQAEAGAPTPTLVSTPVQQSQAPTEAAPTGAADQPTPTPTATTKPAQPAPTLTATTKLDQPAQPAATKPSTETPTQPPTKPPTATPTQPPTPTKPPTATPTKSPTPIPPPEIVAFLSDTDVLYPGECVTLQWTTRNATEIYLDQWSVAVPAGQRIVCYDELAVGSKGFRLTAVNAVDSVSQDLYIQVEPPQETTLDVPFVADMSGSVSADGRDLPFVSPGDDGSDIDYEGFITFDIRGLPANASITSAYLNLGPCSTNGDPAGLSDLRVLNLQYGDLDAGDYAAGGAYITSVDPCTIFSIDVASRVEAMKAEVYFQLRLYFDGSDYDGDIDDVTYTTPTLTITYIIP